MSFQNTDQFIIHESHYSDEAKKDYHQWACYFHTDCFMTYTSSGNYYHVVKKSTISKAATQFNCRTGGNEFWELIGKNPVVSILYDSSLIFQTSTFLRLLKIFKHLAENNLVYDKTSASDFVKKHILIRADGTLVLVNRHLIRDCKSTKKYMNETWIRNLKVALFPKSNSKTQSTNVPSWVNEPIENLLLCLQQY